MPKIDLKIRGRDIYWLPGGQLLTLLITTFGFAILARTIGPLPFASFALCLFIFTITCLLLDSSTLSYLLVRGIGKRELSAARKTSISSGILSAIAIFFMCTICEPFMLSSLNNEVSFLCISLAATFHFLSQVPRAKLLTYSKYKQIALIDVLSTVISTGLSIQISLFEPSLLALSLQLVAGTSIKFALLGILSYNRDPSDEIYEVAPESELKASLGFGLRTIPLNLGGYLSRSLDSSLLPLFLPALSAATYARSYQTVVAPISQLQLSLGGAILKKMAFQTALSNGADRFTAKLWGVLRIGGFTFALLLSLSAGSIANILFGDRWPYADIFIAAMCCTLPIAIQNLFFSWSLQIDPRMSRNIRQLFLTVLSPIVVLLSALTSQTQIVLVTLVISSLFSSTLQIVFNRAFLPKARTTLHAVISNFLIWLALSALFGFRSFDSGFWTFNF